jgi:hypothetical protein
MHTPPAIMFDDFDVAGFITPAGLPCSSEKEMMKEKKPG